MSNLKFLFCLMLVVCHTSYGTVVDRKNLAKILINHVIFGDSTKSREILEDLKYLPPITSPEFILELTRPSTMRSNFVHYDLLPYDSRIKDLARPMTDSYFLNRDYSHFGSYSFDYAVAKTLLGNAIVLITLQNHLVDRDDLSILGTQNIGAQTIRHLNSAFETLISDFVDSADVILKKIKTKNDSKDIMRNFLFNLELLDIKTEGDTTGQNLSEILDKHFLLIERTLDTKLSLKTSCLKIFF